MKIKTLIEKLKKLDMDADVYFDSVGTIFTVADVDLVNRFGNNHVILRDSEEWRLFNNSHWQEKQEVNIPEESIINLQNIKVFENGKLVGFVQAAQYLDNFYQRTKSNTTVTNEWIKIPNRMFEHLMKRGKVSVCQQRQLPKVGKCIK